MLYYYPGNGRLVGSRAFRFGVTAMDCDNNSDIKNRILILEMKLENYTRNLAACPEGYRPGFELLVRQTKQELEQVIKSSRPRSLSDVRWSMRPQLIG